MGVDTAASAGPGVVPTVVDLDDNAARDPLVAGAKAAALARARAAGLPVLPGSVVTTAGARTLESGRASAAQITALRRAWSRATQGGRRALVVRSSSTNEDGESRSMAGMFKTVLDVRGWDAFVEAVGEVVRSGGDAPIAVLVQPFLEPAWGGVLFGADPVTGRTDRLVVAGVPGGPDRLVSGHVDGVQFTLSPRGRLRDRRDRVPVALRRRRTRRALAGLARRAAQLFAGPQDIEWAIEAGGQLVLLQSRPITAIGDEPRTTGPVLGPGPVAETFPHPLQPLEEDLWVPPLRDGLRHALEIAGATAARQLRESPIVVTVGGRVSVDLDLLGLTTRRRSVFARLDPRPPARRLKAAWRVGRLKVALPALADDLIGEVDADLRSLPELRLLPAADLIRLLRRSHQTLVALHGHEVLAGLLLGDDDHPTAAAAALRVLAEARGPMTAVRDDGNDEDLVAAHPVLLSLVPPRIGDGLRLPPPPPLPPATETPAGGEVAVRESLRLRVRWVQEATSRAALELGRVLAGLGALPSAAAVAGLRLDELVALAESGGSVAHDPAVVSNPGPPLPASFRLTEDQVVVPVATGRDEDGIGAGGGRGSGRVHVGVETAPAPGDVLVVPTLDPSLAGVLPGLGGLVAETGSVLSHLAILAREYGVPTVVALAGAVDRFAPGAWVVVDGATGEVAEMDTSQWRREEVTT